MNSSGHWFDVGKRFQELKEEGNAGERPVIEIGIGEVVGIVLDDGRRVQAQFVGAEKNRVSLMPIGVCPYLGFALPVRLERANGEGVKAAAARSYFGRCHREPTRPAGGAEGRRKEQESVIDGTDRT